MARSKLRKGRPVMAREDHLRLMDWRWTTLQEEINVLGDKQDLVFNYSKDVWIPKHPNLIPLSIKAQETLSKKTGVRKTKQYLDPKRFRSYTIFIFGYSFGMGNTMCELLKGEKNISTPES